MTIAIDWEEEVTPLVLRPKFARLTWESNFELAALAMRVQANGEGLKELARAQRYAIAVILDVREDEVTPAICAALVPSLMERVNAVLGSMSSGNTAKN